MAEKPVDAAVPADQGLSGLGLLMQLAGNVLAAYAATLAFTSLFSMRGSGQTLWVLILLGGCITRSLFHRNAGTQLLYGNPTFAGTGANHRTAGIRRYLVVALLQTVLTGVLLAAKLEVPDKIVLGIVGGLAVWPLVLAVLLALPRFRRFKDDLPLTEDKGFEGASILMSVLGLCGLVVSGATLIFMLDLPSKTLTKGPGVLIALALGMLVVRSFLHVQAGITGLRETSVDHAVELANRYANFGVISAFCFGGAMLMVMMASVKGIAGLAMICGGCWMLMAWPLIVRRFFSDRQFADLLAGDDAPVHHRAPDAGLTSLGWLLLASSALSASFLLPQVALGDSYLGRELESMLALGGFGSARSVWFSVGLVVLQAWAGFELVRMSRQSHLIAMVFGIVGTITTLYIHWPILDVIKETQGFMGQLETIMFASIAISLLIPISTLILVNRKVAPIARARFRPKPPQSGHTPER